MGANESCPQPRQARGFLLSGGVTVRIVIEAWRRTLVVDLSRSDCDIPDEPQPRGDVYSTTERSFADEPAEMRVGFHGITEPLPPG